MKKKLILFSFVLIITQSAFSQHVIGSGGDTIRLEFEKGRASVIQKVKNVQDHNIDWLKQNTVLLLKDLHSTSYHWVVDQRAQCDYNIYGIFAAPLYLSYSKCIQDHLTNDQIEFIILKNSLYHLGLKTELDISAIYKVINTEPKDSDNSHNENAPAYDSQICSGPRFDTNSAKNYFKPGSTHAEIGNYQIYLFSFTCNEKKCQYQKINDNQFEVTGLKNKKMLLTAESMNQYPYFNLSVGFGSTSAKVGRDNQGLDLIQTAEPLKIKILDHSTTFKVPSLLGSIRENCISFSHDFSIQTENNINQYRIVIYGKHSD